jgi:CrcB protein
VTALLVVLGAALGAPTRYLVDVVVRWWLRSGPDDLPWGTAVVNLAGSLLIGVVAGATLARPSSTLTALVGTGFCGALTTYSTFSVETVRLVERGRARAAAAYAVGSLVAGVALCAGGYALAVGLS